MVKQHVSPAQENQIDLLMSEGGGYERQLVWCEHDWSDWLVWLSFFSLGRVHVV
jgi:hypothetical protein